MDAYYNLIYIVTYEENRLMPHLKELAHEFNMDFFVWDLINGAVKEDGTVLERTQNSPVPVIQHAIESNVPTMYVLKDAHVTMRDPGSPVIRALRNFKGAEQTCHKIIIITAPTPVVPADLQKQITLIDYELPTFDDIMSILERGKQYAQLEMSDEEMRDCAHALQGLTTEEIEDVTSLSLAKTERFDKEVFLAHKKQILKKDEVLEYFETDRTMDDIGGLDLLKSWLRKTGDGFSDEAIEFGVEPAKGVLILGIPGTGKSLTAKVAGKLWGMPVIRFDIGKVMDRLVGSSEARIRNALRTVEALAPCVLWMDEIEKALSGMGSSNMSDGGTTSRVVGTLLSWMQDRSAPVFLMATANSLSTFSSNPELLRSGRFDAIFFVDLPQFNERKEIFSIHLKMRGRKPENFDLDQLALATESYTGAEIEQVVKEALKSVWAEAGGLRDLTTEDLLAAIHEVVPLSRTMGEQIAELQTWAKDRAKPASSKEEAPAVNTNRPGRFKVIS